MADVSALETLNLKTFLDGHTDMDDAYLVRGIHVDKIQDKVGEIITQVNLNTTDIDTIEAYDPDTISPIKSKLTTLTATEIVGTAAGDLGHAAGAIIVAAPGAGYALEFISAVLIYDYDTAAYTGGAGDDLIMQQGTTTISAAVATADLLTAAADKIVSLPKLATDVALTENSTLNLHSTEVTQPGTAAGVIRVHVQYRVHTTGLA